MRHFFGSGLIVAGQGVEAHVDPRRQHETVVRKRRAVSETDGAGLRIDLHRRACDDVDAVGGDLVVSELLNLDVAYAGDHFIAEGA